MNIPAKRVEVINADNMVIDTFKIPQTMTKRSLYAKLKMMYRDNIYFVHHRLIDCDDIVIETYQ